MSYKRGMTAKTKKEIMIAVLLAVCLLFGIAVMVFVEKVVGTPVFYDGEMKNICVRITEVCASNRSIIASDDGEFFDYIELYNYGETFNLADFGLSNESGNSVSYRFGDIEFKENSYLIVYLDGINVPFRLNSEGNEYLALVAWDGTVIAKMNTVKTLSDEVMLYTDNGYEVSTEASPGYPNTEEGVEAFRKGVNDNSLSLAINELLTENGSVLPDSEGDFSDIIEIKNISQSIVNLKGYFISDSIEKRTRCALPDKELAPGELFLIFADGKEGMIDGQFHADFGLSLGETAVISSGAKHVSLDVAVTESNMSQSLVNTENGSEYQIMYATPGFENTEAGREALEESRINKNSPLVINEILLSQDSVAYGGKLRDVIEIMNISDRSVSTSGYYISDSLDEPYAYALPKKELKSGEAMVIYAEKGVGDNITGFGLSSGDMLYLTTPDYRRSEYVSCAPAGLGYSRILVKDGGEAVYVSDKTSIGFENTDSGAEKYASSVRPSEIEISEAVALNKKYLPAPYGNYYDFVELHNRTDSEISLDGYFLSDDPEEPRKGSLDGVKIPAGGYVVIILAGDGLGPSGYKSLDFSLSSSGETVTLSKGDEIIDCMAIPSVGANTSYGRADGKDGFSILKSPTPNETNSEAVTEQTATPTASIPQGVYKDTSVTVELSGEGDIYYTLDCTEPTTASKKYTGPITLTETTVIRAAAISESRALSKISDFSYIINEPDSLEAISLVTTPENLWDYYHGIYETGPNASATFPYDGANYYYRWEKEANISFFASDGSGFSEDCGVRIFGGLSRALPKKSFALFFRSSYGAGELKYKLFEDSELDVYEAFVLRNTGQDYKYSSMRDAMITSIASDMLGLDVQKCRPVVVYLNGEYWGIYFIREKLNEDYVAGHYNISSDKVDITFANGRQSEAYMAMVDYASSHDLRVQEHYDYISSIMDIDNYIDYIVAEMVISNTDNGNIRFFTYEGGKWRWIMYDVDHGFRSASYNTVADHLDPGGTGGGNNFSTRLINALLKNPEFKDKFLREIAYQLENIWTEEVVFPYIDEFKAMIVNDMPRECERWQKSYAQWESSVESLKSFIKARESYVEDYVKSYFSLSDAQMREYGFDI